VTIDNITGASTIDLQSIRTAAPTRAPKQTLDSEAFMALLVAQLTNQDPSSPMDTNQMIGQTTQLAMMEKLTELATTGQEDFSLQMRVAAAAILGREVSYLDVDGESATGTATAVSYAKGVPIITVGDVDVPLDLISGMKIKPAS
jgi:flagellar basal-body rod modification protein FlgD